MALGWLASFTDPQTSARREAGAFHCCLTHCVAMSNQLNVFLCLREAGSCRAEFIVGTNAFDCRSKPTASDKSRPPLPFAWLHFGVLFISSQCPLLLLLLFLFSLVLLFHPPFVCINKGTANECNLPASILFYFSAPSVNGGPGLNGEEKAFKNDNNTHTHTHEKKNPKRMMLAKLNGFNYALTLERDIFLLVSQPTYRRHLSILKRGELIHQKERNTLTKCHSALIKVHSAPKLQHMFNKGKHFCMKLFFSHFLWESEVFGCEKSTGQTFSHY